MFKQHMNYRDLYELTLKVSEELKLAYELKEMYRDFNKNCSYEEADPACYKEFAQLLKNRKPEIINSFHRLNDSRRQSNALAESYNQMLLDKLTPDLLDTYWITIQVFEDFPIFNPQVILLNPYICSD